MTCVLAYRLRSLGTVLLASDSETNLSSDFMQTTGPKYSVKQVVDGNGDPAGEIAVGLAGHGRIIQHMEAFWNPPPTINRWAYPYVALSSLAEECLQAPLNEDFKDEDAKQLDCLFLVVWDGQIYGAGGNLSIMSPERPFLGIGSGGDYATGALAMAHRVSVPTSIQEAKERMVEAFDIAAHCAHGVSPPYRFVELEIPNKSVSCQTASKVDRMCITK